jgi:hypothetical protein
VKVVLYLESEPDQWSAAAIYDVAECFPDRPEGCSLEPSLILNVVASIFTDGRPHQLCDCDL